MKQRAFALGLAIVLALAATTVVVGQGDNLPGSGWWFGCQVQNMGTANGLYVGVAYDSQSNAVYTATYGPVPSLSSLTCLPQDFAGMPPGFAGSAIFRSNQPMVGIVNVTNREVTPYGTPGGLAGGQYQSLQPSMTGPEVRFPIVKQAFYNKQTTMFVQNAGALSTTVHAAFVCVNGQTYTWDSGPFNHGQMVVVNPSAAGIPDGQLCSGTVTTGAGVIAGTVTEHWLSEPIATLLQAARGLTPADFSASVYAPIYKYQFPNVALKSRTTGAQIMNVGTAPVTITATYAGTGGTCGGWTASEVSPAVQPGASWVFLRPSVMPVGCLASARFTASAGGQLVGVVNESYLDPVPAPGTQASTAYDAFSATAGSGRVLAPLYKEKFGGKTTGLQVQNVASSAATIYVVFREAGPGGATYTTINFTVPPLASQVFLLVSDQPTWFVGTPLPPGRNVSATVYSDQPILGIAQEMPWTATNPNCYGQANGICYDRINYEAFNMP